MKSSEIPQDKSALEGFTRELCYAKNEAGEYDTVLSTGWDVKKDALENAWEDIEKRIEQAKLESLTNHKSPLFYWMEKNLMDIKLLSKYSGFFIWQIKRHFKPHVFSKLTDKKLKIYADIFGITIDELKNKNGN